MKDKFTLNDFSSFDKMIAPSFLTALYYLQMGAAIFVSLWFIFKGIDINDGGMLVLGGLVNLVFAPLLTRLLYEFIIVIFKIHSRLVNIDLNTANEKSIQPAFAKQAVNEIMGIPVTPPVQTQMPDNQTVNQNKEPEVRQDFWNSGNGEPQFTKPDLSSVNLGNLNLGNAGINLPNFSTGNTQQGVDLQDITQKFPNWKLAVASFIVFVGIVSSYASGPLGIGFSIKDSAFGIFAMFAAIAMVVVSAMSMRMQWYIVGYAITLAGTVLSFLDDRSLFSISRNINKTIDGLGGLFPKGNNYFEQAQQNAPSIYSSLSVSFYLMIIAMVYCGYCIVNGQYKERVSSTQ